MNRAGIALLGVLSAAGALHASRVAAQSSHEVEAQAGIVRTVDVPFDYQAPASGTFQLRYELGRRYEPTKPTIFVIADGQQYYVRQGTIAPLQGELFGDRFNVVGIFGRGSNPAVLEKIRSGAQVDWPRAYELLRAEQWVADIESVRKAVVGANGRISLYGRSGGGLLVDQYLTRYPAHVRTVFTQAAVNRFLDAELGLNSDRFWDEIGHTDPSLQVDLLAAISAHPQERAQIVLLLQRQNFFVPAEQLPKARAELIHALAAWDTQTLAGLRQLYQVDPVLQQLQASANPAANVRLFEFIAPLIPTLARAANDAPRRIDPDYEVARLFAAPLLSLLASGTISVRAMDLAALTRVGASVYLLAGRFDHTADYRVQIALAAHFPEHRLLLLADDHDFLALGKTGLYPELVQAALLEGCNSKAVQEVEARLGRLRYSEF